MLMDSECSFSHVYQFYYYTKRFKFEYHSSAENINCIFLKRDSHGFVGRAKM